MALIATTGSTYSTFTDYTIQMYRDYWYRVMAQGASGDCSSYAVHVNSQGRIANRPPQIISTPPLTAREGELYQYNIVSSSVDTLKTECAKNLETL